MEKQVEIVRDVGQGWGRKMKRTSKPTNGGDEGYKRVKYCKFDDSQGLDSGLSNWVMEDDCNQVNPVGLSASTKPPRRVAIASGNIRRKRGRSPTKRPSDCKVKTPIRQAQSDDDQEELLAAVNYSRKSSLLRCSSPFWKEMEHVFAPVPQNASESAIRTSFQDRVLLKMMPGIVDLTDKGKDNSCLYERLEERNMVTPLFQRLLSTLIVEDEYKDRKINAEGYPDDCIPISVSPIDGSYEQLCWEDKLLKEMQSIGLYPETGKSIDSRVNVLSKEIEDEKERHRQFLDQAGMDRLVEMAYEKHLATNGSMARKLGVGKVSKQASLAFTKRTLARCKEFAETGKSCFSEDPLLRDAMLAPPIRGQNAESPKAPVFLPIRGEKKSVDQPLASGDGQEIWEISHGTISFGSSKERCGAANSTDLSELESKELHVAKEIGGGKDVAGSSFDRFFDGVEEDDLPGLEEPRDDLSDFYFF